MLRWIKLQGTSQRIAEVPSQNICICVYVCQPQAHIHKQLFFCYAKNVCTSSGFFGVGCHDSDTTETDEDVAAKVVQKLPCRVIFKIKFLTSSFERERERLGEGG